MASGKPSGVVIGGALHEITRGNRPRRVRAPHVELSSSRGAAGRGGGRREGQGEREGDGTGVRAEGKSEEAGRRPHETEECPVGADASKVR